MDGLETLDMSSKEIDGVVKSLQISFQVHHVGDAAFFATAYHVERLALAIHNPGVINSLRMYDRLQLLVEMLLAIEAWRTFVLPTGLIAMLEENSNVLRVTFILHTESTLVTLINAILYEACSRVSEDVTVALMDYCARSMQILGEPLYRNRVVQHQRHIGPAVSVIQNALWNAEFKCCILAATALVRNFCESFDELSLAAQTRLLETRDVLMLLVPLIEEPPWTRKLIDSREQRTWEKFIDNQWTEVKREQLLKLTPCEGQCWISLFYLTCNGSCQARYGLTSRRKETLLKLTPLLKQGTIISQLPILENVKKYLSKLEETQVPDNATPETPMLEQIDTIRGKVMHTEDWAQIAEDQFHEIFSKLTDATDNDVHQLGLLHASVGLDLIIPAPEINQRFQVKKCIAPKRNQFIEVRFVHKSIVSQVNLSFRDNTTTTMETDHGTFQRRKLTVQKKGENVPPIDPLSVATASIAVMEGPAVLLQLADNLGLQADREWRQFGSLETGLVLQLGFKRIETDGISHCCFRLDKAFLAHQ